MSKPRSLVDSHGRVLRDLRVSLTDRCNFRCLYCLPETEAAQNFYRGHWAHLPDSKPIKQEWVPKTHLLTFEEIERLIRISVALRDSEGQTHGWRATVAPGPGKVGRTDCRNPWAY